jgi:AraC-like DNA-binding protein
MDMARKPPPPGAAEPEHDPRLTASTLLRMELFAPPPAVAPFVTTFFRMECDERAIRDVQPSSIGIVALMAKGAGHMRFIDGRVEPSHPFTLLSPMPAAATFEVEGPWRVFGAMLAPLGWAGLTGLPAAQHGNRLYDGMEMLPPPLTSVAAALLKGYEQLPVSDMVDRLAGAILASLRPIPPRHVAFVKTVADWLAQSLSPDLADLFARCDYGPRQVQRLAERYFGLAPSALARKYRALRAAVLLSRPTMTADEMAAVQDHFYDQSHMIREIRLFAGRTPARIADPDTPYLAAFMELRDFRESGPRMAPIPDDLRG